jgi:hypothetical protein
MDAERWKQVDSLLDLALAPGRNQRWATSVGGES